MTTKWRYGFSRTYHGRLQTLHRIVAAMALGKPLPPKAEVHHVDGNTMNNLNSNLVICEDRAYHRLLHIRANTLRAGGDPNTERLCGNCGKTKPFSEFHKSKSAKT